MAKMIQVPYQSDIIVPVGTAQAVQGNNQNNISLEALGLLVNLLSYPSTWELHKTELYKRFAKHGERSVKAAWNDLMEANYIIEFKYRLGKKYEYVYYFRKVAFTDEEKAQILAAAEKEYGPIWTLRFAVSKMKSSKRRGNQDPLLNKDPLLKDINNDDDKKRTSPSGEDSPNQSNKSINLIISNLREATRDEITERSFKAVVRKVMDKYNQGKVNSFRDYLVTALANKIHELEIRRAKSEAKEHLKAKSTEMIKKKKQQLEKQRIRKTIPFYNWLEE